MLKLQIFSNLARKWNSNIIRRHAGTLGITSDGSTLVAWHAKDDFPYDATKPLPAIQQSSDSELKTQSSNELMHIFNRKDREQIVLELASITHTCKHRWYPRSRDKRAKRTPMDRKYL